MTLNFISIANYSPFADLTDFENLLVADPNSENSTGMQKACEKPLLETMTFILKVIRDIPRTYSFL